MNNDENKKTFYTYINYNDKNDSTINYTMVETNQHNKESVYNKTISDINDNFKNNFNSKSEIKIQNNQVKTQPKQVDRSEEFKLLKDMLLDSINNNNQKIHHELNTIKEDLNNQKKSIIKEIKDDFNHTTNNKNSQISNNMKESEVQNLKSKNKILIEINENLRNEIFQKNKQIADLINIIKENDYNIN